MLSALAAAAAITFAPIPIANCPPVWLSYTDRGIFRMQWAEPVVLGTPSVTITYRRQKHQFHWYEVPGGGTGMILHAKGARTAAIQFGEHGAVIIPDLHYVIGNAPKGMIWRKTTCL